MGTIYLKIKNIIYKFIYKIYILYYIIMDTKLIYIPIYIIILYIIISFFEWFIHNYYMHKNSKIGEYLYDNIIKGGHIGHHKKTYLNQKLDLENENENEKEKELVFELLSPYTIFIVFLLMIIFNKIYYLIPEFKNVVPIKYFLIINFIIIFVYFWSWNSLHTKYHFKKVSFKNQFKYNIIPFFKPDTNSKIYKFLYKYHTLHHLNKGKCKGNYNIICPFFDYIFKTNKSKVDNRLHFSINKPRNSQEEWLYNNQVFDIRIQENNVIEYKLKNSDSWLTFPLNI